ncbi:MAG: type II toxin-antitoxin system VapC family toxin [Methylococcaceae bacterium]|nr:MAG: type II toxin-antitoxin system VapC family toxin [Methylococcaceae bacterium]
MKMLDTNICSYILRRHPQSVLAHFAEQTANDIFLSVIVVAELRFGIEKTGSSRFRLLMEDWLRPFPVHPWPAEAARIYAILRADLERQGNPIGNMDLLIAAHALAEDAVLVTHNTREFERVAGLKLENWA